MIRRFFMLLLTLAALATVAGCSRAVVAPNPLEIDASEYDRMYQAAVLVLRDDGFIVARQNYRFGRIATRPRPSPTIFEPWIDTNTTTGQALEATLVDQRRIVNVFFEPLAATTTQPAQSGLLSVDPNAPPSWVTIPAAPPDGGDGGPGAEDTGDASAQPPAAPTGSLALRVEVLVEQQQNPTHYLTGSTRGGRVIGTLRSTPTQMQEIGIEGPYWQSVGRDPLLEQRLLAAIVRRSVQLPVAPAGPVSVQAADNIAPAARRTAPGTSGNPGTPANPALHTGTAAPR